VLFIFVSEETLEKKCSDYQLQRRFQVENWIKSVLLIRFLKKSNKLKRNTIIC
jgi:hypothetical protein